MTKTKTKEEKLSLSVTYTGDNLDIIKKFKELLELIYKTRNWR